MLIHTPFNPARFSMGTTLSLEAVKTHKTIINNKSSAYLSRASSRCCLTITSFLAAYCTVVASVAGAVDAPQQAAETLLNVPQSLSGDCASSAKDCRKATIQRPKSKKAESCTVKCVNTCIRGGEGSPGEGPLNVRRLELRQKQKFCLGIATLWAQV
ncbi:uncharacterized protein LOC110617005 isoform X3 [Manihot esculenta]|uniref:uncharacterized protein LOC110617005 isoform X3 n=1 Tax=Manihot esculenta TaxID=3983 RepID=UPI001CC79765|nr:uncharacterized protein LOC110617005 isoform X3 [Manihot esculenta]